MTHQKQLVAATSQLQQQLQSAVRCLESQGGQPYMRQIDHAPDTPLPLEETRLLRPDEQHRRILARFTPIETATYDSRRRAQ